MTTELDSMKRLMRVLQREAIDGYAGGDRLEKVHQLAIALTRPRTQENILEAWGIQADALKAVDSIRALNATQGLINHLKENSIIPKCFSDIAIESLPDFDKEIKHVYELDNHQNEVDAREFYNIMISNTTWKAFQEIDSVIKTVAA